MSQPSAKLACATLTTPPGKGGIAVIALWGAGAAEMIQAIFRPGKSHLDDTAGVLRLGHVVDDGQVIDEAIVCRRGALYEINIHGGPLVARQVMELLARRGAEAGGASRPDMPDIFEAAHPEWNNPAIGREMLAALPDAQSELVVAALSQQWHAGISQLAREMLEFGATPKRRLLGGEFGPDTPKPQTTQLGGGTEADDPSAQFAEAAKALPTFRKLLDPCKVVLLGAPNAGKSTLMNALAGRSVSIVHQRPGTTRDWVDELVLLDGVPVRLIDTAGLLDDPEGIDAQAVERARQQAAAADLVLLLSEHDSGDSPQETGTVPSTVPSLRVATKRDLRPEPQGFDVCMSAVTGIGLPRLKSAILQALGLAGLDISAPMAFTQRQAGLLARAAEADDATRPGLLGELLEGRG